MPTSEARIRANQANAALSTGPRTDEGKAQSRRNALKHGLTGSGVVLPEADALEVARKTEAYRAELAPTCEVGRDLVDRAALLAVRMNRSVDQQSAALANRVRRAEAEFEAPEGVEDPEEVAKLRHEAGRRAMFDPSKEAILARKYEAAAERGYYRALKEFRQIKRTSRPSLDPDAEPHETKTLLGSFLEMREEDEEMEAYFAELEKNYPPRPANSPYSASAGRGEVPISVGRRQ